tara:strand:+ start:198 stop:560 length:363 start_codon:yes stop_codon:yes gene_type:complete
MNEAYNKLTKAQQMYVDSIRTIGEGWGYDLSKTKWTRKELTAVSMLRQKNDDVPNWIVKDKSRRVGRGVYSIPEIPTDVAPGHEIEGDGLGDTVVTPVPKFIEDDPQSDEILQAVEELNL